MAMTSNNSIASPNRVSPYARISDTDEERAPGLDRQLRVVLPLIESRAATPTHEYVDNDKSAFKPDVIRDEGFEPWLADFIAGKNDGIAGWDLDRIFRQPSDLERVIKAYCHAYFKEQRPKPVLWTPSLTIDLTDEDGQMVARMLVAVANQSSAKTVKRVTNFYRDEALKGNVFSNYPAFYRNQDGSINEAKKLITLKAVNDVLELGIRPVSIAAEWREQGITTARGGRVVAETVRRILISPGIAGFAQYRKELLIGLDGQPIKRLDGGIVDEDTWRRLCKELEHKRGKPQRINKGLLSRFLRCGKCGTPMVRLPRSKTFYYYQCRSKDSGGCSGTAISGPKIDAQITELVLAYLDQPVEAGEPYPFTGTARLAEIAVKIAELMEQYRGGLSGSIVFPSIKELEDEQRALQAQAAKHAKRQRKVLSPVEEWPSLSLDRKQAIIDAIFECIVITPAKKARGAVYDSERVQPVYREVDQAALYKRIAGLLVSG